MSDKTRVALLIGGGSRVPSLLECAEKTREADVVFVLSCNGEGVGTESARERGIESGIIKWKAYKKLDGGRKKFSAKVASMLKERRVDFIILAGWVVVMPQSFIDAFFGKILNIHPSILPKYPGNGEKAIHAQWKDELRRRRESPVKPPAATGCTLHYIDAGVDTGRHILWGFVDPRSCQTEKELAEAIHKKEDKVLCEAIKMIAKRRI